MATVYDIYDLTRENEMLKQEIEVLTGQQKDSTERVLCRLQRTIKQLQDRGFKIGIRPMIYESPKRVEIVIEGVEFDRGWLRLEK